MRIMVSSPPPWAQSGYGVQAALTAEALKAMGHEIAVSAYAGVHEERDWNGIAILSTGGKGYGGGVVAGNYRRWGADLLLMIGDPWMTDPGQLAGLHVMAWMPVDCSPLSRMEVRWLSVLRDRAASVRPVAMSEFGRQMLAREEWIAPVVPHAVQPGIHFDPGAGAAWRRSLGIDDSSSLFTKIGVNNEDDRKSFEATLLAFAGHAGRYPKSRLYLHTEAQVKGAPNLAYMALDLGLKGLVAFADEHRRAADLYTTADMRAIFTGTDVLDAASKGEGFGVPVIEALACGTPVIGCRNSSMTEKIRPGWGWLVGGQSTWAKHHNAWWSQPSVRELGMAYDRATWTSARQMGEAAAKAGAGWTPEVMAAAWALALDSPVRAADHGRVFHDLYASGKWGQGSGPGSDPSACEPYLRLVSDFLADLEPGSRVLDLGCGDRRLATAIDWANDRGPLDYEGLDVVTGHDIRTCELPAASLVLIKDVFQHWPNSEIAAMRERLAGYPRVLITNTISEDLTGRPVNADIAAGQWRAVDLSLPPFSWPVREVLRWELVSEQKNAVLLELPASS
jgi:Glycosyl transferases group 1